MAYVKEPFKELDIMNNFMFNKLTTKKETKEKFCRLLLRQLLGREVGKIIVSAENALYPDNPNKRGVRLDVQIEEYGEDIITNIYDIEPHRDIERDYAKKIRYQQSQLDKNNMESGDRDFSHIPNLYIINITNYDPFGYEYMVYTIESRCVEVPELIYNDGVKIYYFNTTGTKGGSKELKAFLNYLENSVVDNVVNEATREAKEYVDYIKDDRIMEGDYMTVGDWVDGIVEEAVKEAIEDATATIADKDAAIADKDSEIAILKAELEKYKNIK